MKKASLILSFAFAMSMISGIVTGQSFIGGVIYHDLDLTLEDSPYIVTENLIIADSVMLSIQPGVEVFFEEGTAFKSLGTIQAVGSAVAPIIFNRREGTADAWGGITLLAQSTPDTIPDIFKYCQFYNVSSSVLISYQRKDLVVENCLFQDNPNFTIKLLDNSQASILNNEIRHCGYGVYLSSANTSENNVVEGNHIDNLSSVGILIYGQNGLTATNRFINNSISNCLYGIQVSGGEKTYSNTFSGNVIFGNEAGLLIRNGYNEITSNTIFSNLEGIRLMGDNVAGGKHNLIRNNLIYQNESALVFEEKSVENTLQGNTLFENHIGIDFYKLTVVEDRGNTIIHNTFYANDSASVILKDSPQDSIAFNDFGDEGYPVFYLLNSADQVAAKNWWGTKDVGEIQLKVFDTHDDPEQGEVLVQPVLEAPVSSLPQRPVNPRKQMMMDTLTITWERPVDDGNIAGYRIYYKRSSGYEFNEVFDVGDTTVFKLPGKDIAEKVAVTAVNEQADGLDDQHERNESWYVFATYYPFAGDDMQACEGAILSFSEATAFGYDSVKWVTNGEGVFVNDTVVQAEYLHGDEDLGDTVKYWFYQYSSNQWKRDSVVVSFSSFPGVQAGADTAVFFDSTLRINQALAMYTDSIVWSTSGDGYFSHPDSLNTVYVPGPGDQESGEVDIVLSGMSSCGQDEDTLKVRIIPSYSISGTARIDGLPLGEVRVFAESFGSMKRIAAQELDNENGFAFYGVPAAECYLLYVPSPNTGYLPTYYVNSTRWEEAYNLIVDADVYDIDIDVQKPGYVLPVGEGTMGGEVTILDEEAYVPPIVHLTDTAANIIRWQIPDDAGTFRFKDLPFGRYRLGIEKVGVPYFLTAPFELSPEQPSFENISITIDGKDIKAKIDQPFPAVVAYPTVTKGSMTLAFRENQEAVDVVFVTLAGQQVKHKSFQNIVRGENIHVETGDLPQGMYLLKVISAGKNIFTKKILRF